MQNFYGYAFFLASNATGSSNGLLQYLNTERTLRKCGVGQKDVEVTAIQLLTGGLKYKIPEKFFENVEECY